MDLKSKFILLEFRLETLLGHFIKDNFSTAMSLGKTLITNQTGEVLVGNGNVVNTLLCWRQVGHSKLQNVWFERPAQVQNGPLVACNDEVVQNKFL